MIDSLSDLKKLLQLCRKQGITDIELGTIKIKFGELPREELLQGEVQNEIDSDNPYAKFPDGILSPTQLQYYSSGGKPEDDPELEAAQ